MKKLIYIAIMALSITTLAGCSKTLKSKNMDIEVTLPGRGWKAVTDDATSFVISKDNDMVSFTSTEIPEGYNIPKSEEDIAALVGEEIMAVSEISDFDYEAAEDGSEESVYFTQTLTIGESSSVLINNYKIKDGKLVTAIATLTDADEEKKEEIENIIKSSDLK